MESVSIRDMLESDLAAVHAIETVSFSSPWSEDSIVSEIRSTHSITRAAVLDDSVVGYVMAKLILDEGQLLDISVHPNYRRMKVASMLMDDLVSILRADGCKSLFLEVRGSNTNAVNLYGRYGFVPVSTRKDYYINPPEDAIIMKLEIK
jgi:[ribosomal protein S18]-alanine N-acetyltransferase